MTQTKFLLLIVDSIRHIVSEDKIPITPSAKLQSLADMIERIAIMLEQKRPKS